MDGNYKNFFKKRSNDQFKRKGISSNNNNNNNKKGKWNNSSREQSLGNSQPSDTVYRMLCPSRKIGGVIGKGGSIIKALRDQTQAKITVADSVLGADERVIIMYSSPKTKITRDEGSLEESKEESMQPHCAAQDALLKVHDRILEEDPFGGITFDDDNDNSVVTVRLLVPNNMVGCLLGKRGDVIQRLRSETGANIRVLPAMNTDELVQISGKPYVAKKALYEVSTLLHQNPRKDKPPQSFPMHFGGQGYHPSGVPMTNMPPPGNPIWSQQSRSHGVSPMPQMGGFGDEPSTFLPGGINELHDGEASTEFSLKILCSAEKIGGVIGKGGFNVKQLQLDTGASIHVQDASAECDERVICVSAFETLRNPRSQTIEAILQLQNKTSEFADKGSIKIRLLVASSKVGCILGQGGQVINEMRRRTLADIRVYSKDEKPKCATDEEELVQISGNIGVAKDALVEIASRLRVRTLKDANDGAEQTPVGLAQGFEPPRSMRYGPRRSIRDGPPLPSSLRAGNSSGYDPLKVGREYELPDYPVLLAGARHYRYPNVNNAMEGKIPNVARGSIIGTGGRNTNFGEVRGAPVNLQEICGPSEHLNGAQNTQNSFMASAGQNTRPQFSSYESINTQQGSYDSMNVHQGSIYENSSIYQGAYQSVNAQQSPYQMSAQKSPYHLNSQQGTYGNSNDIQSAHHISMQQGAYQY